MHMQFFSETYFKKNVGKITSHFQDLLRQVERFASTVTFEAAKCIRTGEIYMSKQSGTMYRVRAIKSVLIDKRYYCDCFFIDIGKFEAIPHENLFNCANIFQKIPPQAICFKLFGFQELYYCPQIEHYFSAWILNKQLLGCLMMTEAQYQVQLNHGIKMPKVSITPFVFYPKITLYKPILLKQIGESIAKPVFSLYGFTNAKVSHVSPHGVVYFQLDERSISYIDTLIQQFVSENQQLKRRVHIFGAINCVALIYDIERSMYHRGKIISVESGSPTKYKCYYIDKGDTRSISVQNIFALNDNSILRYYPGQAVATVLHSIPTFDETTFKRLNDILMGSTGVQVKVIDRKGMLPAVTVVKGSVNINKLICMELELQK